MDSNTAGERMGLEYDKGAIMKKGNQSEQVADWVGSTEVPKKSIHTLGKEKAVLKL